ncbi:IscS subfamily cysteine desulfurase [Sporosarcina sp. ACRSM]|uniref:IscS subfamily cysteine desulfurase n=1 Tax=Sporosarcina sp. ACRSM TaxID=2918216 RepID=UPI001EF60C26|nr:IscS subfamily cysteine desulfurase [Sporosarcina sp. ACRSM]MCG7334743.1 IscS subfamily cysteine desulfurase [Sporosarcina sp. ACRSM]
MHYFDYAASTPLHPKASHVFATLSEQCYGNTSSLHDVGGEAQNMLALCRQEFADLLGVQTAGVYFTSGGTESNLLSIISLAKANRHRGKHIVTTAGEHPSIDSALKYLQQDGFTVTVVPFDPSGQVNLQLFQRALREDTILASVQHINPEIGVIQPLEEIAKLLKGRQILLHSDCVQSFGKMDLKPIAKIVDSLTVSGHKVYGPKGVGAAYIHPRHRIIPVFPGFVHEAGFRGGTVNVPGLASFVTAATLCAENSYDTEKYKALRSIFLDELNKYPELFTVYEASTAETQLPQIIGLGVNNVEGQLMMLELNRHGFAISTGSACQVGQQHSAKAMLALQVDPQRAKEFIRISFGQSTTMVSVQQLVDQLIQIAQQVCPVKMIKL